MLKSITTTVKYKMAVNQTTDEDLTSITKNLEKVEIQESPIKNKGTGAGGANTNKNGLSFEERTDLKQHYKIIETHENHETIKFPGCDTEYSHTTKTSFLKYMKPKTTVDLSKDVSKAHGCKQPDECFIDEKEKIIFIIEKKFQQVNGSVCEKIQTSGFKRWHFKKIFPGYTIIYSYCLSDWFKDNCKSEIEYLNLIKTPVFWGDSETYKKNIIIFITDMKISDSIIDSSNN